MGEKEHQKIEETALSSSSIQQNDTIIIDLTQLHVNQIEIFHRIIEIADEITRMHINRITFNHRQFQ